MPNEELKMPDTNESLLFHSPTLKSCVFEQLPSKEEDDKKAY